MTNTQKREEDIKDEIYTLLGEFVKECTKKPFLGEPLSRRARKNQYTDTFFRIFTTLLEEAVKEARGKEIAVGLVKEFKDKLIDIAISNTPLRGAITSNQIIEAEQNFWTETHEALTPPITNKTKENE